MRIGIFSDTYFPDINGVVTSLETLRLGLIEKGHEVFVIANHSNLFEVEVKDHLLLLPGMEMKFTFNNKLSMPFNRKATKIVKSMNLDIIHVQTEFGIGIFARRMAKKFNIPLIYTYHTTWEDYTHYINPLNLKPVETGSRKLVAKLSKRLCKSARFVITPSYKTKQLLISYGVSQPIFVIPTGLDLSRFQEKEEDDQKRLEIKQKYHLENSELIFIYLGRIGEEKGLDVLIDAFELLQDENVKLLIVGGGPQLKHYQEMVESKNLENKVILTDKVPNTQVAYYYQIADYFVSASMTETQGLTFVEAMACGNPVLGSDHGVLEDLVIEDKTGYYFNGSSELENLIRKLLLIDTQKHLAMKEAAMQQVEPFSKDYFVDEVEKLYIEAIK